MLVTKLLHSFAQEIQSDRLLLCGKAPYTPWLRIYILMSSAKGIFTDSVRVVCVKESRLRLL